MQTQQDSQQGSAFGASSITLAHGFIEDQRVLERALVSALSKDNPGR